MRFTLPVLVTLLLLPSCGNDSHPFDAGQGQRRGTGNAPLRGPNAGDVIRDVHDDRARQNYEDRRHRRNYGYYP